MEKDNLNDIPIKSDDPDNEQTVCHVGEREPPKVF